VTAKPVVACIVQARIGSTRLPAKTMLPLPTGRSVVREVMARCLQIKGVDKFVLAIPDAPENDMLAEHTFEPQAMYDLVRKPVGDTESIKLVEFQLYRGSEHNVLSRYLGAADMVGADVVMRITSDCPCLDPEVCANVLEAHLHTGVDYTSNVEPSRTFPHGFDCEVFWYHNFWDSRDQMRVDVDEHVTTWMRKGPEVKRYCVGNPAGDQSHIRLTLDTLDDYVAIWKHLKNDADQRLPLPGRAQDSLRTSG